MISLFNPHAITLFSQMKRLHEATTAPEKNQNGGNKAKHWTITLIGSHDAYVGIFENIKQYLQYYCYGQEVCPTTGTLHLQCYLVGRKQVTLPTLRRWFGANEGNSYAVSKGTPDQNREYCKKDGIFTEFGDIPESKNVRGGKATQDKWKEIAELACNKHMVVLKEHHPKEFVSNYRNLKQIGFDFNLTPEDLTSPCGIWYWGKSGVGKSYRARQNFPGLYQKMFNKWWDNYEHQSFVLLDDMDQRYSESMHYFLKIWADEYAFRAEVKNHSFMIRPKKIIVTSQFHPRDLWTRQEDYDAIKRRFTILEMIEMEDYDSQDIIPKSTSKKRRFNLSMSSDVVKPYKSVDDVIVENTKPVRQPKIDAVMQGLGDEDENGATLTRVMDNQEEYSISYCSDSDVSCSCSDDSDTDGDSDSGSEIY